jgi:single-stranded-DNA-specific exonuclease
MDWQVQNVAEDLVDALCSELEISATLARLLLMRGLDDAAAAQAFLHPKLQNLTCPFEISFLRDAAVRVDTAIENAEKVFVFGDYDVDGVTSTVLLVSVLRVFGLNPHFFVPRRLQEGYGLSVPLIERALSEASPDLVIAVDCGTNAHEPIRFLQERGIAVIVVDHHQAKNGAPNGCLLVNPHVNDAEEAPWRNLCTVGLVFKLLHGLLKLRREQGDARAFDLKLSSFLDLVALGTIADLVTLSDENRLLSWVGLQHLKQNRRSGIRALAQVSGLDKTHDFSSADIAFKLGPRINASGRLDDATKPVEMLLDSDFKNCLQVAGELNAMNSERQAIERLICQEAEKQVADLYADDPGLVLYNQSWHPGVVGIVASRISRQFNRPCLVLGAEGSEAKGSGRSVPGVDLVAVLQENRQLLGHWGGHPMAVGVSLDCKKVTAFRKSFVATLKKQFPKGLPAFTLELDAWIDPVDIDEHLMSELDLLHPYGQGNPEPLFGMQGVVLEQTPSPMGKGHHRFFLPIGPRNFLSFVAWSPTQPPPIASAVDLAFRLSWNVWRGKRTVQATLIEWRFTKEGR